MSCEVCPVDTIPNAATKRVEFTDNAADGLPRTDNVFLCCAGCAGAVKPGAAIITDLAAPDA